MIIEGYPKTLTNRTFGCRLVFKRQFLEVNAEVLEQVDPVFFGDMRQAAFKALGLS